MPKSIETYYQECGIAGCDGQLAFCIMFYKYSDYYDQQKLIYYSKCFIHKLDLLIN
jgi:bloom syndrome protein